jgi:signal transduction histidine kinase
MTGMELVSPPAAGPRQSDRRLWLGYAGLCAVCWLLYAVAGTEWLRGSLRLWDAMYEATWNLAPPMLLGLLALPWLRLLQRRFPLGWPKLLAHTLAAIVFAMLWQAIDFALALWLFGPDHARATLEQRVLWLTIWAVVVYTALVLGFGGALNARRAHAAALTAAQAEAALVRAELAAISGKLNPHFLFNTLNSVSTLIRINPEQARAMIMRLSRIMRGRLRNQEHFAPLRDELAFIEDYLSIELVRFGDKLRVVKHIDPATLDMLIPSMLLQPLIENSIRHGLSSKVDGGAITIQTTHGNGRLSIAVEDDGVGIPEAELAGIFNKGIGVSNVKERLKVLYNQNYRMLIDSQPGRGTRIEIEVPETQTRLAAVS